MGVKTHRSGLPDAELCRANKWAAGTILEGDEGRGPERIRITAVGELSILAVPISGPFAREGMWTLTCREWREVKS